MQINQLENMGILLIRLSSKNKLKIQHEANDKVETPSKMNQPALSIQTQQRNNSLINDILDYLETAQVHLQIDS